MSTEQDKKDEPVDKASDSEYMDTGVLHERTKKVPAASEDAK